jgi:hypothetical protein
LELEGLTGMGLMSMHLEIKGSQEDPMQIIKTNVDVAAWDICT